MNALLGTIELFKAKVSALEGKCHFIQSSDFFVYWECKCLNSSPSCQLSKLPSTCPLDRDYDHEEGNFMPIFCFSCPWVVVYTGSDIREFAWKELPTHIISMVLNEVDKQHCSVADTKWTFILPKKAAITLQCELRDDHRLSQILSDCKAAKLFKTQLAMETTLNCGFASRKCDNCSKLDMNSDADYRWQIYHLWVACFAPDYLANFRVAFLRGHRVRRWTEMLVGRGPRQQFYFEAASCLGRETYGHQCFLGYGNSIFYYGAFDTPRSRNVISALLVSVNEQKTVASIWYLATSQAYRGKGHASKLVAFALADISEQLPTIAHCTLMCDHSLEPFYKKLGFKASQQLVGTLSVAIQFSNVMNYRHFVVE